MGVRGGVFRGTAIKELKVRVMFLFYLLLYVYTSGDNEHKGEILPELALISGEGQSGYDKVSGFLCKSYLAHHTVFPLYCLTIIVITLKWILL